MDSGEWKAACTGVLQATSNDSESIFITKRSTVPSSGFSDSLSNTCKVNSPDIETRRSGSSMDKTNEVSPSHNQSSSLKQKAEEKKHNRRLARSEEHTSEL